MFVRIVAAALLVILLGARGGVAEVYKVGPGDKLRISIYQWDALNNSYTVDPDGLLALPIVGNVRVGGEGTQAIGSSIARLLAEKMKLAEAPTASVEVVQFRPFSILGDVAKPGDYPFRPGMIALDALAMAGGYYRPEKQAFQMNRDVIVNRGKLAEDAATLERLYVRRARLDAAARNKDSFNQQSVEAGSAIGDDSRSAFVQEAAIFADQRSDLKSKLLASESLINSLNDEIAKQKSQIAAIDDELRGLTNEKNNVRSLVSRGISTNTRETSLDVIIGDVTRTKFEIETNVLQVEEKVQEQLQKRDEISLTFRDKNLVDMFDVDRSIATLKSDMSVLAALLRNGSVVSADEETISIVRRTADGIKRIAAQELDPVEPDDILIFEKKAEGK